MIEHTVEQQELMHLGGRVELRMGTHNLVADIRDGTATVTVLEDLDDQVYAFGTHAPIRELSTRRRLRLEIEGPLGDMTISFDPAQEEAVASPDAATAPLFHPTS